MAVTVVPSVMVNLEALNHDNYEHWSFRVKTYLMAEGLWNVVQGTDIAPKRKDGEAELKNNAKDEEAESKAWQFYAKALHAIHISCGKDAESSIRGIEKARDAWNELAREFKPLKISEISELSEDDPNDNKDSIDADADADADVIEVRDGDETYAPFFNEKVLRTADAKYTWYGLTNQTLSRGYFGYFTFKNQGHFRNEVREFIREHPEAETVMLPAGQTALSYAVSKEDVEGVKELLPYMKKTDLKGRGSSPKLLIYLTCLTF